MQHYLAMIERKMTSTGATAKEPWVYLAALKSGGQLSLARQHLFSQPTIYEALVSRLAALCTGEDVATATPGVTTGVQGLPLHPLLQPTLSDECLGEWP